MYARWHVPSASATPWDGADEEFQLLIIEALGWHPLSYQRQLIGDTMKKIAGEKRKKRYSKAVRDEALKTYNRLYAK